MDIIIGLNHHISVKSATNNYQFNVLDLDSQPMQHDSQKIPDLDNLVK